MNLVAILGKSVACELLAVSGSIDAFANLSNLRGRALFLFTEFRWIDSCLAHFAVSSMFPEDSAVFLRVSV